ncbi:MAG TPA: hypothetical protein VJT50_03830, partial [Pyrinomonadaceae bacterium]|nr:hypothetical protein [Pyrinomonadaceae bacterium]
MARRPRFTTRFTRIRDLTLDYLMRPLNKFRPRTRFFIGFVTLVIFTIPFLTTNYSAASIENYREGDIIRGSVVARGDITAIDISETDRRRNEARQSTRPIFNFDSSRGETSSRSFRAACDDLRLQLEHNVKPESLTWSGEGGPGVARALASHKLSDSDVQALTSELREVGDKYIYDDAEAERLNQEIVLVDVRSPATPMVMPAPRTRMLSLTAARQELELKIFGLPGWTQEQKSVLVSA